MSIVHCDCSVDVGDHAVVWDENVRKARKRYCCCECGDEIPKGATYHRVNGLWDGEWSTYTTCLTCAHLRDLYCYHGYHFGDLAEQLEYCFGFDYRVVPEDGE